MTKIKVLDDLTIKKIAAGEVIENPASIVKELVENSIDAKSTNISIEIKSGGKEYIRISDNGNGMSKEDLELAFKRHSTSKLRQVDDIYNIMSLGFRGEALASISSVARIEVLTKTEDFSVGNRAYVEDGEIKKIEQVGTSKGTTMIIEDIFYNLPVRKKFLKSDRAEGNYIENMINRLALGNPHISFRFIRDNKPILHTDGKNNLKNTIYTILGKKAAENIVEVNYKDNYMSLNGYISNNQLYRGNRSHQFLYINGRYVMDYAIMKAIENRYKTLLPVGRFPIYVLNLDIDPKEIDVNIHPTKQEIKFVDSDRVIGTISNNIHKLIMESLNIPKLKHRDKEKNKTKSYEEKIEELPKLYEIKTDKIRTSAAKKDHISNLKSQNKEELVDSFVKDLKIFEDNINPSYGYKNNIIDMNEIDISNIFPPEEELKFNIDSEEILKEINSEDELKKFKEEDTNKIDKSLLDTRIIGRVFNTYIILEDMNKKSLFLIDQHAAHERIMYETYKKDFEKEDIAIQQLLVPQIIDLSNSEMSIYKANIDLFSKLGFDIDIFGQDSIAIRGLPLIFGRPENQGFFIEILDNLDSKIESNYDLKINKIMKIACVNAIKAGDNLDDIEIQALIQDLLTCKNAYTCPHGRPTILELSKKDLEEMFLRII